jgi:uncharacterized protein (DUF302 family)
MSLTAADSPHDVRTTIDRLVASLKRRGIAVLAHIDHSGGARAAGLELADEELLIFGDPRVGTLLMQRDPEIGYELPLRVLVWDADGQTRIAFRAPAEVAAGYAATDQVEILGKMDALLEELVAESTAVAP